MSNDKKSLRSEFRAKREAITVAERHKASQALVQQLYTQDWFLHKQAFALYSALPSEIDTQPLITALWQRQKNCYLPRITATDQLVFAHYTAGTVLLPNRFGIPEPPASAPLCALPDLDIIFMPLVAFDKQGHRLGMGAGYYDKTLATLPDHPTRPLLVGLAYELQKMDHIPQDPWDISLDIIITEKAVYTHSIVLGD
jgi:5-formyltetrahydrofolate cyclo-ligase